MSTLWTLLPAEISIEIPIEITIEILVEISAECKQFYVCEPEQMSRLHSGTIMIFKDKGASP